MIRGASQVGTDKVVQGTFDLVGNGGFSSAWGLDTITRKPFPAKFGKRTSVH